MVLTSHSQNNHTLNQLFSHKEVTLQLAKCKVITNEARALRSRSKFYKTSTNSGIRYIEQSTEKRHPLLDEINWTY